MTQYERPTPSETISTRYIQCRLPNSETLDTYLNSSSKKKVLFSDTDDSGSPIDSIEITHGICEDGFDDLQATISIGRFHLDTEWQKSLSASFRRVLSARGYEIYQLGHDENNFFVSLDDSYAVRINFKSEMANGCVEATLVKMHELAMFANKPVKRDIESENSGNRSATLTCFLERWQLTVDEIIHLHGAGYDMQYPKILDIGPIDQLDNDSGANKKRSFNVEYAVQPEDEFDSVGGYEATKQTLNRIAATMTNPDIAKRFGVQPNRHFMLYGPPGTGKSSFVAKFAAKIDAELTEINSSSIVEKWVGASAQNIRKIFDDICEKESLQVIFFEEFDVIAKKGNLNNPERESVRKELGIALDDVSKKYPNVIVVAATNMSIDDLEPSLVRAGRIEPIEVGVPTAQDRSLIWAYQLKLYTNLYNENLPPQDELFVFEDIDLAQLVLQSEHMTGADIVGIIQWAMRIKLDIFLKHGTFSPITHSLLECGIQQQRQR